MPRIQREPTSQPEASTDSDFLKGIDETLLDENHPNFARTHELLGQDDSTIVQVTASIKIALGIASRTEIPTETIQKSRVIMNTILEAREMVGYIDLSLVLMQLRERRDRVMGIVAE